MNFNKISKQNKQVICLYISTLAGVILGVLASIVNTRFLPPTEYGDVRYVQNIINLISSVLLFGYFQSGSRLLALSHDENESRKIRGSMIIILIICSLIQFILLFGCYFIHLSNEHNAILFLISLPVCLYPLFSNYVNTTAQGDNHIGRLSISRILPGLIYVPISFLIYNIFGSNSTLLILLQWGIYTAVYLIIIISTKPSFKNIKNEFQKLREENKSYGIQLYIGSLVMVATGYIAGITLGIFNKDNVEVGYYTLALTVTSPLATLPAIIGTTYFKQFAITPRIPRKVLKYTLLLTISSCIAFIILIKPLVIFLYTKEYAPVGNYAAWMAVGFCIHGFGDMLNRYLGSHGQGKSIRNSSIANGILKLIGYTLFVYLWNTNGAIITNIACSVLYFLILLYYYRKFTAKYEI